ncbi:NAD-dependent deacetylase [Epsilonproteobacteria bacterium SCGC AD-308-P11]|jgi:NAD-dependent deacetylase|nr:NAD-dependent deacetylase [Epsilonproteobacteria bacterium SCGC AD-308-P11]
MARVIILSGAGISAESGISTFRENDGLWEEYDVAVVCNYDSLQNNEKLTVEFYDKRRAELKDKKPNHAHKVIAKLKEKYKDDIAVITQNVDNLFEKAGISHTDLIHLHGFMTEVRCQNEQCNLIFDIGYKNQKDAFNGKCPTCSAKLRPNIVFFGESAPKYAELYKELNDCELFVVIGTSGYVINTDSLVVYAESSILNNLEPSEAIYDALYSKVLYKPATRAIDEIAEDIQKFLNR